MLDGVVEHVRKCRDDGQATDGRTPCLDSRVLVIHKRLLYLGHDGVDGERRKSPMRRVGQIYGGAKAPWRYSHGRDRLERRSLHCRDPESGRL